MQIFIPTMGRAHIQTTHYELIPYSQFPITLVCPYNEYEEYKRVVPTANIISPPESVERIAATRQWIMEQATDDKVVMMDDDLTFYKRRTREPTKFEEMIPWDYKVMLSALNHVLKDHAHGGLAIREGGNRNTEPIISCQRVCRVIGFDRPTFFKEGVDFRNNTVMDDFEATLHLLIRGYPNAIVNTFVQNQKGSGTIGGASSYRDLAMHADAARRLHERYPEFVSLVEKTTKKAWNGATRTDVIIQWKKALAYGKSNKPTRVLDSGTGEHTAKT